MDPDPEMEEIRTLSLVCAHCLGTDSHQVDGEWRCAECNGRQILVLTPSELDLAKREREGLRRFRKKEE